MKKEETQEMEELSLLVFGKRYAWRKLTKKGLITNRTALDETGRGMVVRRMPLTIEGARHYMKETIRMRKEMEEANEPKS